jgi:hypothetical protein
LGQLPEPGIWSIGRTKEESWQKFDAELQARLQPDGTLRKLTTEESERLALPEFDMNRFLENCKEYREWKVRHGVQQ